MSRSITGVPKLKGGDHFEDSAQVLMFVQVYTVDEENGDSNIGG
jgi:hypothetical protein